MPNRLWSSGGAFSFIWTIHNFLLLPAIKLGCKLACGRGPGCWCGRWGSSLDCGLACGSGGLGRCGRRCAGVSPAGVVAGKIKAAVAGCFLGSKKKYSDIR